MFEVEVVQGFIGQKSVSMKGSSAGWDQGGLEGGPFLDSAKFMEDILFADCDGLERVVFLYCKALKPCGTVEL